MALYKLCGCGKKIQLDKVRCDECQIKYEERQKKRQSKYDKTIRYIQNKQYHDFYNSPEWKRTRQVAINRDHALCQLCLKENKITPYHTVHHIKPIKTTEGWKERLNLSGLICVCEYHHQQLHRELDKG